MNPPSSAIAGSAANEHAMTQARLHETWPFYWSVRRELWEYRSIYIALLATAGVVLFGFFISAIGAPHHLRAAISADPAKQRAAIAGPYNFAAGAIMLAAVVVTVFYCLGALNNERRDRSILFWKSLPVSDLTTVVSKAFIPIVVLQLLSFAITVATQSIMLLINSAVVLGPGPGVSILWTQLEFFHRSLLLLYHLITVHALWYAPIYCWFLLVSAWARRAPFLWAVLPPLAIVAFEKIVFNSMHFANLLKYRLTGGMEAVTMPGTMPMDLTTQLTPWKFLSTPGVWLGLMVAAMFLAVAVRLRRYREPI